MYPECNHIKTNGIRCGSPALRGRAFCFYHARPARARVRKSAVLKLPALTNKAGVLDALGLVVVALAAGKLEVSRASSLLYALQLAHLNLGG